MLLACPGDSDAPPATPRDDSDGPAATSSVSSKRELTVLSVKEDEALAELRSIWPILEDAADTHARTGMYVCVHV